jgi:hypothetical protein
MSRCHLDDSMLYCEIVYPNTVVGRNEDHKPEFIPIIDKLKVEITGNYLSDHPGRSGGLFHINFKLKHR